tara:strand:+ start:73 stop:885 length:813 start_codon:yes stop_codon:yes gene_type:complete
MKLAFVSTMNQKLYDFYGRRFLIEFSKFASNDLKLFIIFEGTYPEEILHLSENIIVIPMISEDHNIFMKKFGSLQEARGLRIKVFKENGEKKINIKSDYRYNAIRFSYKPFSIHQSLEYMPDDIDYLIWTDADLRCKKYFNADDLKEFLPDKGEIMSYLGRKDSYSECGFLGFNLKLNSTINFINRIIDIYKNGEIFSLEQWHDSFIWDHLRLEFQNSYNAKFKDISGDGFNKEHVYINTRLGEYFDHLKGPYRKEGGTSFSEDYEKSIQ